MNQSVISLSQEMTTEKRPRLIAIVGGSGAGKSWLAARLQEAFGKEAVRISLDDFYQDRSHLSPKVRARINFDHPRAIDWKTFQKALGHLSQGLEIEVPQYDFATHSRKAHGINIKPRPLVIIEGLWLLRSPAIRRLFDYSIFVDCSAPMRLQRRLARDCAERGREAASIKRQFLQTVAPMHQRFVIPQKRWANQIFFNPTTSHEVKNLVQLLQAL